MSDLTKNNGFDDLLLKNKHPNHLASRAEKQAAAGVALPKHLANELQQRQSCTTIIRQALQGILPDEILQQCVVAHIDAHRLSLAVPSLTAANHLRYLSVNCVQALRSYDERFCLLEDLRVIHTPNTSQSVSRQPSPKKALSENTKRIITQTANAVISHDKLKSALLRLAQDG